MATETEAEIVNLYHLAHTALAGEPGKEGRHARMMWASDEYAKAHPDTPPYRAYRMLSRALEHPIIG